MSAAHIGQRRSYDGALCTVRYIGEVAGTTGSWLGVEWDDPSRGKHDGQHKGVRYFSCASRSPIVSPPVRANNSINRAQASPDPRRPRPSSAPRARPTRPGPSSPPCSSSMPPTRPRTRTRPGRSSSRARSPRRSASTRSAASRPSSTSCSSSSSTAPRSPMRRPRPGRPEMKASRRSARSAQRSGSWT